MTPLLSGDCEGSDRIRRNNSVKNALVPAIHQLRVKGADGDLVVRLRGLQMNHQPLFDKWLKGTRLVGEVESMRFLSPDVARMHALGGTVMRGKSRPAPERDSIQTLVAIKRNGEWRLAAFQNTRVRPMSRNSPRHPETDLDA